MTIQVLVAPAAFKGTLGPRQVAEALSAGVRRAVPDASLLQVPIADGGDGLLDAVLTPGSLREQLAVTGPLGTPVRGVLGWVDAETAIFESAGPRWWSSAWAARQRWMAARGRGGGSAGRFSMRAGRRCPKAAARWRNWRTWGAVGASPRR